MWKDLQRAGIRMSDNITNVINLKDMIEPVVLRRSQADVGPGSTSASDGDSVICLE
jgi:hypothetical protein